MPWPMPRPPLGVRGAVTETARGASMYRFVPPPVDLPVGGQEIHRAATEIGSRAKSLVVGQPSTASADCAVRTAQR
jgi:hypothetical protein